MRILPSTLVFSSLLLQVACGDDGGGSSAESGSATVTATNPTLGSATATSTTDPTEAGSATDVPTGGSATESAGSDPSTGPGTSVGTTSSSSTGEPVTATEADTTGPGLTTTTTDSGTTTDPGTTTGEPGSTTDASTTDASTTTGAESTTTGADETTEDVPCQVIAATLKPVVPNMMLVLDKSGSMLTKWDHDANPNTPTITRWNSLYQTVDLVLTKFNDKVNFGANLFPNKSAQMAYTDKACLVNNTVEIAIKPKNKTAILNGIPAADNMTIAGGTPATAGMTAAITHLKTFPADVPRAILLVTDGAANCTSGLQPPPLFEKYDDNVHTVVSNGYTVDGIPTYVVGINTLNMTTTNAQDGNPDSINPYQKLNDLADKGGKPKNDPNEKFYNADNQIELGGALDAIIADALSCVIPLASEPGKPELTKVNILGKPVPQVVDCGSENGWVYTNPNGPFDAIELCGTACNDLKTSGKADVNFFCVPG